MTKSIDDVVVDALPAIVKEIRNLLSETYPDAQYSMDKGRILVTINSQSTALSGSDISRYKEANLPTLEAIFGAKGQVYQSSAIFSYSGEEVQVSFLPR